MNERNLLADTAKIVEKNKVCKRKDDICRTVVTDLLFALGYDASVCKSRWEKTPSYPAGTLSLSPHLTKISMDTAPFYCGENVGSEKE